MSERAIVDAVLATRPHPRRRPVVWAILVALTVHAGMVTLARTGGRSLESWAAALAVQVHQELIRLEVVDVASVPPTPPPEQPPPPPKPDSRAQSPSSAPSDSRPPSSVEPPPAEAGRIVAAEGQTPLDLTDDVFVTGQAKSYAGGTTSTEGTAGRPGGRGGIASEAAKPNPRTKASGSVETTPSLARPPTPESGDWDCSWPTAANLLEIDEAEVIVRVRVDARGRVLTVSVVEDPGFGFAEAAVRCAQTKWFRPGLDPRGRPTAARSPPIRVRFTR